ncbi:hypothetical protein IT072_03140 [Leifsonia sp. ZF2019]|nr:hypothetical protein [Leifsonia sp. ZF2019]UAJ80073.1 hypothetical protein IT072_03140 [Leifsonia sp. ZF2019]
MAGVIEMIDPVTGEIIDQQQIAEQLLAQAKEQGAMKARDAELRADARAGKAAEKDAADALARHEKIESMPQPDRAMAERLQQNVFEAAPELLPNLYYGQPAWARDGKLIVFFRSGQDGTSGRFARCIERLKWRYEKNSEEHSRSGYRCGYRFFRGGGRGSGPSSRDHGGELCRVGRLVFSGARIPVQV